MYDFGKCCDRCHDIIGFNGKEKLGGKKQNKQALKEDTDCLWFGLIHVSIKKHDQVSLRI